MSKITIKKIFIEIIVGFFFSISIFFICWLIDMYLFDLGGREELPSKFIIFILPLSNIFIIMIMDKYYFRNSWSVYKSLFALLFNILGLIIGFMVGFIFDKTINYIDANISISFVYLLFGIPFVVIIFSVIGYNLADIIEDRKKEHY